MSNWDTALAAIGTPTYRWDMTSASQPETDLGSAGVNLTVEVAPASGAAVNPNENDASRDFESTSSAYLGVNADVLTSAITVATYMMWFRPELVTGFQTLIAQGASGSANAFGAIQVESDGTIAYTVRKNTSTNNLRVATAAGVVTTGNDYFLAVVCTGGDYPRIYLNGVLLSVTVTRTGSVDGFETLGDWTLSAHNRFAIGALRRNTDASYWDGLIDDVVIFHGTALSSSQIANLYAGQAPSAGAAITYSRRTGRRLFGAGYGTLPALTWPAAVNAIGATAWYQFDEASGDIVDGVSSEAYTPTNFNALPFNGTYQQTGQIGSAEAVLFNGQGCLADSLEPWGNPSAGTVFMIIKLAAGCPDAWVWMEYDNGDDKAVAIRVMDDAVPSGVKRPVVWLQNSATGDTYLRSTVNIADGDWHTVAAVFSGSTAPVLYVDGVEDTGASLTVGTCPSDYWLDDFTADGQMLGARAGVPSDTDLFKGYLDELVFFNSALSSAQIAALHTATGL